MFKRVTIVALVVAAFLVLAVPALAWNGYRSDYTTSEACQTCHSGTAGIPAVYKEWAETKHGENEEGASAVSRLPYGSVCGGCHSGNYAPSKVIPTPTATSSTGAVSWANTVMADPAQQTTGNAPYSELSIGCSSCHYGANVAGGLAIYGVDANDTAHTVPLGNMADAQICGACHSRYSYTVDEIPVSPVPYVSASAGTPITPNPNPTTAIQPQMAIGYPMLGYPTPAPAWSPVLAEYLNVQQPGWTPTPTATSTGIGNLMTYWQIDGQDTKWQNTGHDGSAAQYPEWKSEGHAAALTTLTSMPFWASFPEATKQECLECHSADFRLLKEAGENPTSADVKYGVTCVGCHAPHDAGNVTGVWDEEFDAQLVDNDALRGNGSNLCVECHNGEIPAGSTASPGAEVHHPMKEMMDGYGAIDVAKFPSVHKGKCIQCHMVPTSVSRGSVQLGANHTFEIVMPSEALETSPIPVATTTAKATAGAVVTTTTTVTQDSMPYSACSTCHTNNNGVKRSPTVVSRATSTPTANAVSVNIVQNANETAWGNYNGGDRAEWLQDTIDQRQEWTLAKIDEIHSALDAGAVRLGYADEADAYDALVAKSAADRTESETNFLKAFTNVGYVESEGSFGLHNWDYSRQIVNTAMWEAESVGAQPAPAPWSVTFKASKTSVKKNTKVKYSGTIAPADALAFGHATVTIQRYSNGTWKKWKTTTCNAAGSYSITVKMTSKGTFKLRALMPAFNAHNMTQGVSPQVSVKVK